MKLRDRMTKLEQAMTPAGAAVIVMRILDGESNEEATARYEAEHGPIYDPYGSSLRVLIRQLG